MSPKRIESIRELKSVYLLYGDEELLMDEALKRLKDLMSSEVDPDFNLEVLDASEAGLERIIDSAETIPLLSARRLVIVREYDRLTRKEQQELASYLETQNPETTLVLVAHFTRAGEARDSGSVKRIESSVLYKKVREVGEVLKFSLGTRGRQEKLNSWVGEQFKKRGKKLDPAARALLFGKVGIELRDLEDAIERICLFSSDAGVIGTAEVEQVAEPVAAQGVFEFVDSVADRRRDISLYLLNRLMRQGESPYRLYSLLLRQFRLIARVKALSADHDYPSIASRVGIPPFLVSKCLQQAKRFSAERLRSIFLEFKKAQVELHSSRYLGENEYQGSVLEMMVVKIIG